MAACGNQQRLGTQDGDRPCLGAPRMGQHPWDPPAPPYLPTAGSMALPPAFLVQLLAFSHQPQPQQLLHHPSPRAPRRQVLHDVPQDVCGEGGEGGRATGGYLGVCPPCPAHHLSPGTPRRAGSAPPPAPASTARCRCPSWGWQTAVGPGPVPGGPCPVPGGSQTHLSRGKSLVLLASPILTSCFTTCLRVRPAVGRWARMAAMMSPPEGQGGCRDTAPATPRGSR